MNKRIYFVALRDKVILGDTAGSQFRRGFFILPAQVSKEIVVLRLCGVLQDNLVLSTGLLM